MNEELKSKRVQASQSSEVTRKLDEVVSVSSKDYYGWEVHFVTKLRAYTAVNYITLAEWDRKYCSMRQ